MFVGENLYGCGVLHIPIGVDLSVHLISRTTGNVSMEQQKRILY